MKINTASFVVSNQNWEKCPEGNLPEFSFIGRSNVGKSSLINAFTGRKSLAKISNKPGKTQLINHFLINENWYLVDLPGYGYAKTSKVNRKIFSEMISDYLLQRKNLITTFVLIDVRLKPQQIDLDFITFLGESGVPFCIVFTKADKLKESQLLEKVSFYKEVLLTEWEKLPTIFISSSVKRVGLVEIGKYIEKIISK